LDKWKILIEVFKNRLEKVNIEGHSKFSWDNAKKFKATNLATELNFALNKNANVLFALFLFVR